MRVFGFEIKRAATRAPDRRRTFGGGRYRVVTTDESLREPGEIERGEEYDILDRNRRGRLLDMARNQVRNSSTFAAMLRQFDLNAVGRDGGKATFSAGADGQNDAMRDAFARWARSCEFYDGRRLNDLLRVILKTYLVGGECVLLFDDGLVEDSGKILLFEPDEMANLEDGEFASRFPSGWQQVDGHVLNGNGRLVGVFVSRSARGEETFPADSCYKLLRDPDLPDSESQWLCPRNMWRKNQVIGVSPIASSIAAVADLEDLATYELQSAKKNSQTLAQVVQDKMDEAPPSAFDGADVSSMTDEEVDAAAEEVASDVKTVALERIRGAGCLYEVMPEGTRLDILDTKHPNPNMPAFIDWQAGRTVAPLGLSRMFATMKVEGSFSACQGEINMSWPAFEDAQVFLEQICDWIVVRWAMWAARRGMLPAGVDPDGICSGVAWSWPRQKAVNAVDEQNAIEKRLRNYTGSYADIYGADWREKLAAIGREIEWCKENGIVHPSMVTVAGAQFETAKETNDED